MSFFKKIFSSTKDNSQKQHRRVSGEVSEVYTDAYFQNRYTEEEIESSRLEGSLKMIDSYFLSNSIQRKIEDPINHPLNLDQSVEDGMGIHMYSKAFELEESQVVMFLTVAFNDYMIKNLEFKLYKDKEPEFPMRSMTLKYDKNGAVLSLYPFEYCLKVLKSESTFEDLYLKIKDHLENLPNKDELLDKLSGED
ncbi:MAG: hypothetical protein QNK23_18415 [Crocinitomicaceae bacterium]|nr:hypothetical protein [Crocinitomicaceae bacterium]